MKSSRADGLDVGVGDAHAATTATSAGETPTPRSAVMTPRRMAEYSSPEVGNATAVASS